MTMGIATILDARQILLVATGTRKARMLALTVEGPMTAMISGTALQSHPNCLVLADEPAAAQLTQRAYYDHVALYDPEILALPA
jgi:glucosamine-6-phosphate deaminase